MILTHGVEFSGRGLHGGREASVSVLPSDPGAGPRFRMGGGDVPLLDMEAIGTGRCTTLRDPRSGSEVGSVEHLLAALAGLDLWDVIVVVRGDEIPVLDGSALPFTSALLGAAAPSAARAPLVLGREVRVSSGEASLEAVPEERLVLEVTVHFPHPSVGGQSLVWEDSHAGFLEDLSPARTFGFLDEVMHLRASGLAAGGSLECALVYGPGGVLNPGGERFTDEVVRHKTLDLLGDLALLSRPLGARVRARRPSHALNHDLVRAIRDCL